MIYLKNISRWWKWERNSTDGEADGRKTLDVATADSILWEKTHNYYTF